MPDAPFGFLNINKPLGITSHDVVNRVRRIFGTRKVGHAGTLDPLATGVLVICVGAATRLSEYVMSSEKTYRARVRLGQSTTTYDAEGDITAETDAGHLTQADVEAVLPRFVGEIQQVPPVYSAIKQGGKKLYEMARAGEDVRPEPRAVHIHKLMVVDWQSPDFSLDVTCGSGTYIRSLAHDIGAELGVGGHLVGLERTRSGGFRVGEAVTLDTLAEAANPAQYLQPPLAALEDYPVVVLDDTACEDVRHGRTFGSTEAPDNDLALAVDAKQTFIAVIRAQRGKWRPHKVFSP